MKKSEKQFHWNIKEFLTVYNDRTNYPTLRDVANKLQTSTRTVRRRAKWLRDNNLAHYVIDRANGKQKGSVAKEVDEYAIRRVSEAEIELTGGCIFNSASDYGASQEAGGENGSTEDLEIVKEGASNMARKLQKIQDLQRMERKAFRESVRRLNIAEELNQKLVEALDRHKFHLPELKKHRVNPKAPVGVVHLSDLHFNECVDLPGNKYNWEVASARIRKHIHKSRQYFKAFGVDEVLVAMTGDLLNSDRRLDEALLNSTNRTHATILAVDVLRQAFLDLNNDFQVSIASVCGNEGRVNKDIGFAQPIASENYDQMIFLLLYHLLKDAGIRFNIADDPSEVVINVNGQNLLLVHGHAGGCKNPSVAVPKFKAKYSDQGIMIDYVIWGHIHEAYISDTFARSGSPVGNNDYSAKGLNLSGRASQNSYLFYPDRNSGIDGLKVDLQDYDLDFRYEIDPDLYAYNSKSLGKIMNKQTIFQVVI